MPHIIDLRSADDSRDVVHRAVQALAEGHLVVFPTETVYALAASGLNEEAVERLRSLKSTATPPNNELARHLLVLAVKSADEALDYVPDMDPVGRRLARRCWPGPVTMLVQDDHPESLLVQLAPSVKDCVAPGGLLGLRVPAHQLIQDVMRLLAGPIVLANASHSQAADAITAQQAVETLDHHVQLVVDDGRSRFAQPSSVVRVRDGSYEVIRVGVVSEHTLKRLASVMILFVCTGNTCRSPMAEALFRHRLAKQVGCKPEELEDRGVMIMSAGISAMPGSRPTPEAVTVMGEQGIDLTAHGSQPLTEQLVRQADLILVMTRGHRDAVLNHWPEAADRVHLLSPDGRDVADPIGGPPDLYRQCAQQIDGELDRWLREIKL